MTGTESSDLGDRIACAAVDLAATRGWRGSTVTEIADEAGVTLGELSRHYSCKPEILDGFERLIDRRMLSGVTAGAGNDKPRDRLFEIVMSRFDALMPHRDGVRRIMRELPFDQASGLVLTLAMARSAVWMLAGAGLKVEGPMMPFKMAAITGLYLSVFRVWLNDRSEGMSKTMATLDRRLGQLGSFIIGEGRRNSQPPGPNTESAAPDGGANAAAPLG